MAKSKAKGSAYELEIVRAHHALGIAARKQPLSGSLGGIWSGDVVVAGMSAECKRRRAGFGYLRKALEQGGGSDLLFCRDDHQPSLVVMPWETYTSFLSWAHIAKHHPFEEGET